jgi:ABC-type branched-subunit amino acid transport system ATPase component
LVIETHDLSKAYKGVQALKDLNLTGKQHSIFGFLGPNGAGKTTTMKILLGLIKPTGLTGSDTIAVPFERAEVDHPEGSELHRTDLALARHAAQVLLGVAGVTHGSGDADEILDRLVLV